MAYKKVGWKDYPSTDTPINATNLDHMDAGILENAQTIGDKTKISGIGDGTVAGAIAANKSAIDANAEAIAQNTQSLTQHSGVVSGSFQGKYSLIKKNNRVLFTGMIFGIETANAMIIPDGFRPTKDSDVGIFCDGFNGTWGHAGSLIISNDGTTNINTPIGINKVYYYKFNGSWDV